MSHDDFARIVSPSSPPHWRTRPETDADRAPVYAVNAAAFETSAEADLVDALRTDPAAWLPGLSYVAEAPDGSVAAYALITRCRVGDAPAAALAAGTPVLGICRGMQLLNVALGGTLVQHLEGHAAGPGRLGRHQVRPVPGTRYGSLVPEAVEVPTYHHQAVERLGAGLVVSAHAEDGTVEAVELPGSWVLGVQWHPEMGDDTRVMAGLVRAASA
ncbi:gamma-glutamyl-gamma-aminobutyrate hydrolase family protein [Streptomyces sp. Act-28]